MRIGIAQIDCQVGDVETNGRTIAEMVEGAAAQDCDLLVLPEMVDTGYVMHAVLTHASAWDDGPCRLVRELAARHGLHVICGLSEREGDRVYNAVAVVDAKGDLIGKYRKAHLFTAAPVQEHRHLGRGEKLELVRVGAFTVGIMVCYDLRFPEMARALALGGADVLVVPSAFPFPRLEHWKTLTACRAVENQVYVAAANRVGSDDSLTFCGTSRLLDPYGIAVAAASEIDQTLIVGELRQERIDEVRAAMHVFADRRPELYDQAL